jgi:TPR repeat protein
MERSANEQMARAKGHRDFDLGITVGEIKMGKVVKLIAAASALWLSAASCGNSAGLSGEQAKYRHDHSVAAVRTAKPSARQRSARADALLGFKYEHGLGVPQSFDVAVNLYLRSAERGDPTGQFLLGLMYDKGHGVSQDEVLAHKWLNLAAAHAPGRNREYYLRLRDAIASKMTPAQVYAAQGMAVQWAPKPPQWDSPTP